MLYIPPALLDGYREYRKMVINWLSQIVIIIIIIKIYRNNKNNQKSKYRNTGHGVYWKNIYKKGTILPIITTRVPTTCHPKERRQKRCSIFPYMLSPILTAVLKRSVVAAGLFSHKTHEKTKGDVDSGSQREHCGDYLSWSADIPTIGGCGRTIEMT